MKNPTEQLSGEICFCVFPLSLRKCRVVLAYQSGYEREQRESSPLKIWDSAYLESSKSTFSIYQALGSMQSITGLPYSCKNHSLVHDQTSFGRHAIGSIIFSQSKADFTAAPHLRVMPRKILQSFYKRMPDPRAYWGS